MPKERDIYFMQLALEQASLGAQAGEVPVGAVVVQDQYVIGQGFNCPISTQDPSAHAEVVAIRNAAKTLGNYRFTNSTLYVTLEPCSMCAGLLVHARIQRLVFATREPKAGAVVSRGTFFAQPFLNHTVALTEGILVEECAHQLQAFFRARRLGQGVPNTGSA